MEKVELEDYMRMLKELRDIVADLRVAIGEKMLEEKSESNDSSKMTGLAKRNITNFIRLRTQHRTAQMFLEQMKAEGTKKKEVVDEKNVDLQSLVYQKTNLVREIGECKTFKTTKLFGLASYPQFEPSDKANHGSITAWLKQELIDREKFNLKYKELSLQKAQAESELEEQCIHFERYPSLLQKLEEAAAPLQKYFGIHSEEIASKLQEAKILPAPLHAIFMKFEGYREKLNSEAIEISIIGDRQKAETVLSGKDIIEIPKKSEASEGKPGEISDNSKKIKKKQKKSIRKDEVPAHDLFLSEFQPHLDVKIPEQAIQKFPLAVRVTLKKPLISCVQKALQSSVEAVYPLELNFFFYHKLQLVTCIVKAKEEKLTSLQVLHSLFAEDDGHYVIEYLKAEGIVWQSEDEKPYSWVNFLAGFYDFAFFHHSFEGRQGETYYYDPQEISVDTVLSKVHARIMSICALKYQADWLSKSHQIVPDIYKDISSLQQFKIVKDQTVIREFNQTIREFFIIRASSKRAEFLQPQTGIMAGLQTAHNEVQMRVATFVKAEDGSFVKSYKDNTSPCKHDIAYYYNVLVERGDFTVCVLIEIGYNYPHVVPNIILNMEAIRGNREERKVVEAEGANFGYGHVLREMEKELMMHWNEFCPEEEKLFLLSYQVKKLTTCVEIFAETESGEPTTLYKKGKKGVTRSRPFAYNATQNIYEQR